MYVASAASSSIPAAARVAYSAAEQCPLLMTKRSRFGHAGFRGSIFITDRYSVTNTSVEEKSPPGWPSFA
jgi:hypothetical protein